MKKAIINIMVIMRSEEIWTLARKMKDKVKRKRVNWYNFMCSIKDDVKRDEVRADFYLLMKKHPTMSWNRLAYNALKHHYSTTALKEIMYEGFF